MKTIKQLEKEIRKIPDEDKRFIFTRVKGINYMSNDIHENLIKQEKLQTLQEVCKEIKGFFKGQKISLNKKNTILPKKIQNYTNGILERLKEELLKKFQGEENV